MILAVGKSLLTGRLQILLGYRQICLNEFMQKLSHGRVSHALLQLTA